MPSDLNLDNLGNPTWSCYSSKSFTTIGRYGQYQAESFRHSLKEETQKLKQATSISSTNVSLKNSNDDLPSNVYNNNNVSNQNGFTGAIKRRKAVGTVNQYSMDTDTVENSFSLKTIKFGTNVDLSDEKKFAPQIKVIINCYRLIIL